MDPKQFVNQDSSEVHSSPFDKLKVGSAGLSLVAGILAQMLTLFGTPPYAKSPTSGDQSWVPDFLLDRAD